MCRERHRQAVIHDTDVLGMEMKMKDYIVRATAADNNIRIFAAVTGELVETARKAHGTSDVITAALGRLLTGGALMAGMMKNSTDVLTLQIGCSGPVRGLTVTASKAQEGERECVDVKGYAVNPAVELPLNEKGKLDVGGALGAGILTVIKDMGLKEPFSGQTQLVSGEIAEDLTYYFANSEQTPSAVALGVLINADDSVRHAGGFIVQLLPFADDEVVERLEKKLAGMEPITKLLDKNMSPEEILHDIFDEFGLEITDTIDTRFRCNCSKERVSRAIRSIDRKDIKEMINEGNPVEVNCHFCGTNYIFTTDELQKVLDEKKD